MTVPPWGVLSPSVCVLGRFFLLCPLAIKELTCDLPYSVNHNRILKGKPNISDETG